LNIQKLLQPEIQKFIINNLEKNTDRLLLNSSKFPEIPMREVVTQIQIRQKATSKFPTWISTKNLIFPSNLSYQQASSEQTAQFKSELVSGKTFVDLTGGFGVDTYFFSKQFQNGFYVEQQNDLTEIVRYNYQVLGVSNVKIYPQNLTDFLAKIPANFSKKELPFDLIYLDPARRNTINRKVVRLSDCTPNLLEILPQLLKYGKQVLLKTSPLLDISQAVKELGFVQKVWVVAVKNECKELLFLLQKNHFESEFENSPENLPICAVNLENDYRQIFDFQQLDEKNTDFVVGLPEKFLFRPNSAILKSGGFKSIGKKFGLKKLHPNSHLYTASKIHPSFSGKIYRILQVCKFSKKEILKHLPDKKANIATANFPMTPSQIYQKLKIKSGGNQYLFGTTNLKNQKIMLVTERV